MTREWGGKERKVESKGRKEGTCTIKSGWIFRYAAFSMELRADEAVNARSKGGELLVRSDEMR
jgi:hypothetical protein